jgi:hypothetical protein
MDNRPLLFLILFLTAVLAGAGWRWRARPPSGVPQGVGCFCRIRWVIQLSLAEVTVAAISASGCLGAPIGSAGRAAAGRALATPPASRFGPQHR